MEIYEHNGEVEITGVTDFDLNKTFECGQCFRWNADENGVYTGVAFGRVARLRCRESSVFISGTIDEFDSIWRGFFDLSRDYAKIRQMLCIDDFMIRATEFGAGIRLLRQDKWEALCSFIISQNNNIPRIKTIIDTLCREFGEAVFFEDNLYYTFPSAGKLAVTDAKSLAPLRCGYRAEYLISAAKSVASGAIDLVALSKSTPDVARSELKKLHGVGDKVADCVMLFGLNMLDAFPIDVWMKRAVEQHYGSGFDFKVFSPYAGIAQQYIFHYSRKSSS